MAHQCWKTHPYKIFTILPAYLLGFLSSGSKEDHGTDLQTY